MVVRHPPSKEYNAVIYNIWCAGISPNILAAMEPSHANTQNDIEHFKVADMACVCAGCQG
jgi:hypothetical protein